MSQELPHSNSSLGETTGILAVDVRRFSAHNNTQQRTIVDLLSLILRDAATKAGLPQLWEGHVFRAFRGDGYLFGVRPSLVSAIVDRYFDSLQNELRRRSPEFRADEIELRLRASLHLGPVESFDALITDSPHGKTMVDTGRMVDAGPVRALLDHSDPNVTFVAFVVSRAVMEHVVEAGKSLRRPSEFVEAPLEVEAKEYAGTGYLRVPTPSGELLTSGLLWGQPEPALNGAEEEATQQNGPDAAMSNTFGGIADLVTQTGDVRGGIDNRAVRGVSGGVVVTGDNSVAAGQDAHVHRPVTTQDFSGTFFNQGDGNFGPNSGRRTTGDNQSAGR